MKAVVASHRWGFDDVLADRLTIRPSYLSCMGFAGKEAQRASQAGAFHVVCKAK